VSHLEGKTQQLGPSDFFATYYVANTICAPDQHALTKKEIRGSPSVPLLRGEFDVHRLLSATVI
jgi:hypothetical protein